MNVMVTGDSRWCVDMSGTTDHPTPVTGPVHSYARLPGTGGGLAIYNGLDTDILATAVGSTPGGQLAKIWLQELEQPRDGTGLGFPGTCVSARPTPPPSLGGVAGYPDLSSGSNAPLFVAIATTLAAVFIAGGAWYARRRSIR
jgi:hypothetical protein